MLRGIAVIALFALVLTVGCGGGGNKTVITQFPRWEWRQYERIAVMPFTYEGREHGGHDAARQATFMFEDLLAANGNFTLLERGALKNVLTEQDLSQLSDVADPGTIIPPGKIQTAQALIVGKITHYGTDAQRHEHRRPIYARDDRGRVRHDSAGRPVVVGEEVVNIYKHVGSAAGGIRVIDTATGKVIFSHAVPTVALEDSRQGVPPSPSPDALAAEAARSVAVDCYKNVAPIRTEVKISGDCLHLALDYYDGRYDKTKKVPYDLDKFMLVVRGLPRQCDLNSFRVAVAPEEGRNLFEEEFVWYASDSDRGKAWEIPVALLRDADAEKFVAKLYSGAGDAPVLERDFKLDLPDNKKKK